MYLYVYINIYVHTYIYIYYSKGWAFNPVGPNSAGPSCKSVPCRPHSLQKPKWSWQTGIHQVSKKGALFGLQKKQFKEEKGHLLFGIYIYIIVYIRAGVSHIYISIHPVGSSHRFSKLLATEHLTQDRSSVIGLRKKTQQIGWTI
jgi:hypothetical protein